MNRRIATGLGAALLAAAVANARPGAATSDATPSRSAAPSVGDLARVRGVRSNQLVGLGLVVGLRGTGDTTAATEEAVRRFAAACGFEGAEGAEGGTNSTNAALVVVTAELPPFAADGARMDVRVSAVGDAASVSGGTLVATPLWAGSRKDVFARAQGPVSGGDPERPATVGIVRGGGIVERAAPPVVLEDFRRGLAEGRITLDMKRASAEAASATADAVNRAYGIFRNAVRARASTPGEVEIVLGPDFREDAIGLLAEVLSLPVDVQQPSRIVVNERLGTVAASGRIAIAPASVTSGGLFVTVGRAEAAPRARDGAARERSGLMPEVGKRPLVELDDGATLDELVRGLRDVQATTQDVIDILQGLVKVGALRAEIVVE